ncbi:hypothetical protein SORBI_3010G149000 [Sorghum bicolor]|uniref:Uncharacterized protein n=1 Tax=Sorghum bicolor TaxID=4558 RepID=A0A194YJA6_SORBI|nr:hypothetical protein SORBI_3010G149000 [Sorghum bicolor]
MILWRDTNNHRLFVIATTNEDASTYFFHHCPTSHVLDLISPLCTILLAPVTLVEYHAHPLQTIGLLLLSPPQVTAPLHMIATKGDTPSQACLCP